MTVVRQNVQQKVQLRFDASAGVCPWVVRTPQGESYFAHRAAAFMAYRDVCISLRWHPGQQLLPFAEAVGGPA